MMINCRKRLTKIYHLDSNLLPHYVRKCDCNVSTLNFYNVSFNANMMQNCLFLGISVYQGCQVLFHVCVLIYLQYYFKHFMCLKYLS